ncbi:helix-turn-helix domain-containing protein [Brachybacterium huguangmaarense]
MPTAVIRAHLRPWIVSITGYDENVAADAVHFGAPSPTATIVLAFTEPLDASWGQHDAGHRYPGLAAGLHTRPSLIRTHGIQHGIHIALTPAGVRTLLRLPAAELAHCMVELGDCLPELEAIRSRLEETPSWRARFGVVQDVLERCAASRHRHAESDPFVGYCWAILMRSAGTATVASLAATTGVSRRTIATRFRRELGVGPKEAARIIRYDNSVSLWRDMLTSGQEGPRNVAHLAAVCGYSDHAHLTREWKALGGQVPSTWENFPILQDGQSRRDAD